jgi:hypothetical protein
MAMKRKGIESVIIERPSRTIICNVPLSIKRAKEGRKRVYTARPKGLKERNK